MAFDKFGRRINPDYVEGKGDKKDTPSSKTNPYINNPEKLAEGNRKYLVEDPVKKKNKAFVARVTKMGAKQEVSTTKVENIESESYESKGTYQEQASEVRNKISGFYENIKVENQAIEDANNKINSKEPVVEAPVVKKNEKEVINTSVESPVKKEFDIFEGNGENVKDDTEVTPKTKKKNIFNRYKDKLVGDIQNIGVESQKQATVAGLKNVIENNNTNKKENIKPEQKVTAENFDVLFENENTSPKPKKRSRTKKYFDNLVSGIQKTGVEHQNKTIVDSFGKTIENSSDNKSDNKKYITEDISDKDIVTPKVINFGNGDNLDFGNGIKLPELKKNNIGNVDVLEQIPNLPIEPNSKTNSSPFEIRRYKNGKSVEKKPIQNPTGKSSQENEGMSDIDRNTGSQMSEGVFNNYVPTSENPIITQDPNFNSNQNLNNSINNIFASRLNQLLGLNPNNIQSPISNPGSNLNQVSNSPESVRYNFSIAELFNIINAINSGNFTNPQTNPQNNIASSSQENILNPQVVNDAHGAEGANTDNLIQEVLDRQNGAEVNANPGPEGTNTNDLLLREVLSRLDETPEEKTERLLKEKEAKEAKEGKEKKGFWSRLLNFAVGNPGKDIKNMREDILRREAKLGDPKIKAKLEEMEKDTQTKIGKVVTKSISIAWDATLGNPIKAIMDGIKEYDPKKKGIDKVYNISKSIGTGIGSLVARYLSNVIDVGVLVKDLGVAAYKGGATINRKVNPK